MLGAPSRKRATGINILFLSTASFTWIGCWDESFNCKWKSGKKAFYQRSHFKLFKFPYGLWTLNTNQLKSINQQCYFTVWNTLNDNILCEKTGTIHYSKKGTGMPFQMPGQMKNMTLNHKKWDRPGPQLRSLWNILTQEATLNENINVIQFSVDLRVNAIACCQHRGKPCSLSLLASTCAIHLPYTSLTPIAHFY